MHAIKLNRGFTLVEIMVVVVIVAILAAVALPSYISYITKAKIKQAQSDLVALSLAMENRFQQQLTYPAVQDNTASIKAVLTTWNPATSGGDFNFKISASAASSYTLQAVGTGSRLSGCTVQINSSNERSLSGCEGGNGWL